MARDKNVWSYQQKFNTVLFLKMGQIRPIFVYFCSFNKTNIAQINYNEKIVDDMLGTQTQGGRMVGTDKSTELWWPPTLCSF